MGTCGKYGGGDGKQIGSATYTVEDMTVTAPAVPEKFGYTGAWPSYELGTEERLEVHAVYTANSCSFDGTTGSYDNPPSVPTRPG